MGTIIDKLNRSKSIIESLCSQLNNTAPDDLKVYNLKDIETRMSKIHLLRGGARITSGDVRKGKTFYDDTGILYSGTWLPYSGSTISASDIVKGKNAYDSSGMLLAGTHVCSSSGTEKPYTCTVKNNSSSFKIIKKFNYGTTSGRYRVIPEYCEPGETFDIKVDWGDVFMLILVSDTNKVPALTNNAPFCDITNQYAYRQIQLTNDQMMTGIDVGKWIYIKTLLYYYPANNTSINISG